MKSFDPKLLEFVTSKRQLEILEAIQSEGSVKGAASKLGINASNASRALAAVIKNAALRGYSPAHGYTATVPAEYRVKGVSQLLGADGEVKAQWVKSEVRPGEGDLRKAFADFAAAYEGTAKPVPYRPRSSYDPNIMTVIPIGDPHFGMFAWGEETGTDFDLQIAEDTMRNAIRSLIKLTPPSPLCVIINLGDFFHTDTTENRTRRSGHHLDVDTRQPKILRVGISAYISAIDMALTKHERVIADTRIGNHDDTSSLMMSMVLDAWYRNEPRVDVVVPKSMFWYHQWGKCLIGSTHGHTVKPDGLPGVMATDRPEMWGSSLFRHWYTGHVHHSSTKEFPGCTVETFRTLAPADSWAHTQGYRSGRDVRADLWHKEHGMVQRFIVGVRSLSGHDPSPKDV
jgi:hypothetical protein